MNRKKINIQVTRIFIFCFTILTIETVKSQHQNIMIGNKNEPEEPSIIIDPANTDYIIVGANISNFYVSHNSGLTWKQIPQHSPYGVWGDPCVMIDSRRNYYYFHLSNPSTGNWIDRVVCQKSTDGGISWSKGTYIGLNGKKAQDKEWATVDRRNNNIYVSWTQFDAYGSENPEDSTIILFSSSTDEGENWSKPVRLSETGGNCIDDDNTVEGAVPAVGPNGEIYVSWAGPEGLVFDKSTDQGKSWLNKDIFVTDFPSGWNIAIPGIFRSNGLPVTACDTSNSPFRGTIYINWTDQQNGPDDTDVWLAKSTDKGETWSAPIRVNNDLPGKHQFFTWMSVDQSNGNLYFIFYDRRNYNDNQTDVFMAMSDDGGETFYNFKISETPFIPDSTVFFGDYNNVSVYNNVIRPAWTRYSDHGLSIWTAFINPYAIGTYIEGIHNTEYYSCLLNRNKTLSRKFMSKFHLNKQNNSSVSNSLFDIYGNHIEAPFKELSYNQLINWGKYALPGGFYIIRTTFSYRTVKTNKLSVF